MVAVITGASGGIGAACARLLAARGCKLLLQYKSGESAAKALKCELEGAGAEIIAAYADIGDEADVKRLFSLAESELGSADILINCAGTALEQKVIQDVSAQEWDELMRVNLRGAFLSSREAIKGMVSRKRGSIVSVSSIWGAVGGSCEAAYAASKAGLIGFTRSLARELGPSGIRVNAVAPGFIDTKMNAHLSQEDRETFAQETPLCRLGTTKEAAKAIVYLALDADFVTGQTLCVDGGYTA